MFGKHRNVTRAGTSQAGPFDQWPSAFGFDCFYGFIGGNANPFFPRLYRGTQPADRRPAPDYIFDRESQDKPFFIYYAPGNFRPPVRSCRR